MRSGTLAKIAPRFGMTLPGLRNALSHAGMLDLAENRPTRSGHVLGGAYFIERENGQGALRFPAWDPDQLIGAIAGLHPGEVVPNVFKSRYGAAHAIQGAAMRLRDMLPASSSHLLNVLADDAARERIVALVSARERRIWVHREIAPEIDRLEAALAAPTPAQARGLREIQAAADWLCGRSRPREPAVEQVPFHMPLPADRDVRPYPDAHSVVVSHEEAKLIESGYELNHRKRRAEDGPLAEAILGVMSRNLQPDAAPEVHTDATGRPARMTRMQRDQYLLTTRKAGRPGMTLASAHRVMRNDQRLNVRSHPDAFMLVAQDGATIVDADGPDILITRLTGLACTTDENNGEQP